MTKTEKIQALINLGLNEREARVYYALLNLGQAGALFIAQLAEVRRATCYLVLQSLISKKLVAVSFYRGVKDYRALPLEHLKGYVRRQHSALQNTLPILQAKYSSRVTKQRLRVYHDLGSVKILLEKSLRERAQIYILGDSKLLVSGLSDYWQYFIKRTQQLGLAPKIKNCNSSTLLLLWSDKIAYITLGDTPTFFAFKNKELHNLYQNIWSNY